MFDGFLPWQCMNTETIALIRPLRSWPATKGRE
jgi:hypothetical protein